MQKIFNTNFKHIMSKDNRIKVYEFIKKNFECEVFNAY